ncbi:MAG TPA: hypothetical protein VFT55_13270, partial [Planctomycetota bacterium]|nr:hypothetical protein [Planctomycetota bacterium]
FTTAGGVGANNIARWDGTSWSALGSGTNAGVRDLMMLPNGELAVGGYFSVVDGVVSGYVAQLTTTCPATASSYGSGCSGSGGANVLTATTLPWIGSTMRAVATGMPAISIAVGVRGLGTASIPLSTLLPQGTAGCDLLVTPVLLDFYVPTAGTVQTQLPIPNTVTLAGQVLYEQVVALELGALGSITAATSTNALTLTIGAF